MSIASGFTKMKNYILTSSGYKLLSRWTSSQTVHMGDGTDDTDTVEYRFGAMKGITSSLATDNDEFALSASAGKNLQDQCTQLNQSLTQQSYITVNPNYGKNISALVVKCNDRYVVNGMIQLTADAAGQDIFSLLDNGEVVRLKNRCDVLFADIVNNKLYAAYGVPGFTGIASNTNAIPSGSYIIHGIIR